MNHIIALPHHPATARHILPLEDARQPVCFRQRNVMPELAAAPVVPPTVFRKGLLLHCGAEVVDRRTLSRVETPSCTESWFPLPHDFLLKEVESQLTAYGFGIGETTHALSHEGKRYFGVLQILRPDDGPGDYSWIVGIRNSHDKTFPASLVMGTRIFVCDNLAFNGEVKLSRKHTRFAVRDLRFMTSRAVGRLGEQFHCEDERIAVYPITLMPTKYEYYIDTYTC